MLNTKNPKYDNDYVTLGYLNKTLKDESESSNEKINIIPKNYNAPPNPPYYENSLLVLDGKIYKCIKSRLMGSFNMSDWTIVVSTDDINESLKAIYDVNKLEYVDQQDDLLETFYQAQDPSLDWVTDLEKEFHTSDLWHNLSDTFQYVRQPTNPVTYKWLKRNVPVSLFDIIDGYKQIFLKEPSNYKKGDLWFGEQTKIAIEDSEEYNSEHWEIRDNYIESFKIEQKEYHTMYILPSITEIDRQMISEIKKAIDEITLTVSQSYTTKTELNTYIDGVKSDIADEYTTKTDFLSQIDITAQQIQNVVSQTEGQNEKIAKVTQTVDSINSKISDIADITVSGESTFATLNLEHINQSEPIQIKIHPFNEDISYIYPSEVLYPSDNLFLKDRLLRFTNLTTNEVFDWTIPKDLLYYDENTYDELILSYDSQTCYINKKLKHTGVNGINALLEEPQVIECEYPKIELTDGDYKIELIGYKNGYLYVQLMAANMYTSQFATKVELNSEIKQTKDEIKLEVSKKTDRDKIIATINLSPETIKLDASKIDINGIVNLINNGTTTTINGNKITTGSITSNQIATDSITSDKIKSNAITTEKIVANSITSDKIRVGSITSDKIATNAITSDKIQAGAITANKVSSDIITTKNFSAQNINADNIKSGTLSADRVHGGTITGSAINLGNGKFVVNENGVLSCTGASFNGSINSSIITGGSINIDSGTGYYFNMGLSTSHPNCSGLNVGWAGINFSGGKGINNTDGYNFNFSSGCLYAVEKILSVTDTLILQRQNGASITLGQNVGLYGGNIYCDSNVQFGEGGIWINLGMIGRNNNITITSSSSIDLLGGTYGVYASKGGGSTSAVKTDAGSYSSRIVKENIKRFTQKKYDDSLELLDRLELYSYDYKYNLYENKSKYGFIIDELEKNELSKDFFDFYEKEAIVNGKELDFNLTHRKETDKTIKLKNYDSDVLDKFLLTCVKAIYNKIKNMEVLKNGK
ncbi:MAG: hypothetical protein HFI86_02225 [Bacilli bacterium]|nr:hypothetical protein [Bacilli bacterium]